jgi:hypothetical protein
VNHRGRFCWRLGRAVVTLKKEGLARWMNFLVGVVGAFLGWELFKLLRINLDWLIFGPGGMKITF